MPVEQTDIENFLKRSSGGIMLDVRSPSEYRHAHIPGAHSLPLFSDEERKVVGTAYKQQGREVAVNEGLNFFSETMKTIQPQALKLLQQNASATNAVFCVYCWRGGMRSNAVAWLLSLYGYKVVLLKGGYKSYRRWAFQQFGLPYKIKILGGFTGSGKTEVLAALNHHGQYTIDLESLAHHKGSAFGSLGMQPQPSPEMFENKIALALSEIPPGETIWLEDESRHIGSVHIPESLWKQMRNSDIYFLEIPQPERLNFIIQQYGCFDKEAIKTCVLKIQRKLGGLETKNALANLENNDVRNCFSILLRYYDKLYNHSLMRHENASINLHKIQCTAVDVNNALKLLKA